MKDCRYFEDELLAGIPYRFRAYVEETLRSFQESKVMVQLFSNAVQAISSTHKQSEIPDIVLAIGSFGRLDGCASLSDYDIIYIYDGLRDDNRVSKIRAMIRKLVIENKALLFDHREEIETYTFDFDKSPAYPVLAVNELFESNNEIRALQILTEGRTIIGDERINHFKSKILDGFGYTNNIHSFDLTPLREALIRMKRAFCHKFIGRLKTENRKISNRKILKLFVLREFFYISSLFALTDIYISCAISQSSKADALRKLSAPSMLKICTLSDPNGNLGKLLSRNRPELRDEILRMLKKRIESIPPSIRCAIMDQISDPGEAELFPLLRALTLSVLNKYDSLLQLLHDHNFLSIIDQLEPDITTWIAKRNFKKILDRREEMIAAAKLLAISLKEILELENELITNLAFTLGVENLQEIVTYQLELR